MSYKPITINTILKFGKYKGELVSDVIELDIQYLMFLKSKNFLIDDELSNLLSKQSTQEGRIGLGLYLTTMKDDYEVA